MSKPQHKTCLSVLRSIIGPKWGQEARFAKLINRSTSWLKKASSGLAPLTEDAAVRIAHETGVAVWWLLAGNPSTPAVAYNREPYTKAHYERRRIELREQRTHEDGNARHDLVLTLHSILSVFHAAQRTNSDPLVAYRLGAFCRILKDEFEESTDKACKAFGLSICQELARQIRHPEADRDLGYTEFEAAPPRGSVKRRRPHRLRKSSSKPRKKR
jgi:hypothetical protein